MSIEALGYVFTQTLPASEKWLLVCLANYADEWGDSIFPSLDELEEKSGMSRATLKRTFAKLLETRLLQRVARSTPVSPPFYRILGVPPSRRAERSEPNCPMALRRAVIYSFTHRCEYCGRQGSKELGPDDKPWTIDRVVPGARGGAYSADNVTLSCRTCNTRKGPRPASVPVRTLTQLQSAEALTERGQLEPSPETPEKPEGIQNEPSGEVTVEPDRVQPESSGGVTVNPDPLSDPLSDPLAEVQAGAAPRAPALTTESADDNVGVLTVLAHEVLDLLGPKHPELVDALKDRASQLRILYNGRVITKALESARWQREHPSF